MAKEAPSDADAAPPSAHPEEMTAAVKLEIGKYVTLRARARATPAGLVSIAILLAAITVPLALARR